MIFSDGTLFEAHADYGGVRECHYKTNPKEWVYYKVPTDATGELKARHFAELIVAICELSPGDDYDYGDLFGAITPLDLIHGSDNKWICSEFAVLDVQKTGVLNDLAASTTTPNSLQARVAREGYERLPELPPLA